MFRTPIIHLSGRGGGGGHLSGGGGGGGCPEALRGRRDAKQPVAAHLRILYCKTLPSNLPHTHVDNEKTHTQRRRQKKKKGEKFQEVLLLKVLPDQMGSIRLLHSLLCLVHVYFCVCILEVIWLGTHLEVCRLSPANRISWLVNTLVIIILWVQLLIVLHRKHDEDRHC